MAILGISNRFSKSIAIFIAGFLSAAFFINFRITYSAIRQSSQYRVFAQKTYEKVTEISSSIYKSGKLNTSLVVSKLMSEKGVGEVIAHNNGFIIVYDDAIQKGILFYPYLDNDKAVNWLCVTSDVNTNNCRDMSTAFFGKQEKYFTTKIRKNE